MRSISSQRLQDQSAAKEILSSAVNKAASHLVFFVAAATQVLTPVARFQK